MVLANAAARKVTKKKPINWIEADPQLMMQRNKVMSDWANYLAGYQGNANQANIDYTTKSRALDVAQPTVMRNLLSNAAARGMAYSSGYATDVGNAQQNYADQQSNLESTKANTLASLLKQFNIAHTSERSQLADIERAMAAKSVASAAARRQNRLKTRQSLGLGG